MLDSIMKLTILVTMLYTLSQVQQGAYLTSLGVLGILWISIPLITYLGRLLKGENKNEKEN